MRVLWAGVVAAAGLALAVAAGCSTPGKPDAVVTPTTDAHLFAPLPIPPEFDRQRAMLPLTRIPDDPPAPGPGEGSVETELPRPAVRHLAEARRLFSEHRYTIRRATTVWGDWRTRPARRTRHFVPTAAS